MSFSRYLVRELGKGTYETFNKLCIMHPIIHALLKLGVRKSVIADTLGVQRISAWRQAHDPLFWFQPEEFKLLDLLIVASRCAQAELEHLASCTYPNSSFPLRKLSHRHEIQTLEANISFANEVIRQVLDESQGNYRDASN